MALKWTNAPQVHRDFIALQKEYDRKSIVWLSSVGERVIKYAREHGSYTDRTGNLRNSIGYVIVQNGIVHHSSFTATLPQESAKQYALRIAGELGGHKTYLVWVAGMEYAKYVEARGFDVIQGSGDWVESTAKKLIEEFKRFLVAK